ncbi:bile acid:sodium symporter family protein [Methanoplanus endosymbiosus]|uniref:Bile acid:sodium symporter n=1 Tax=Methanoplanus endosymbiosus TaxID=33865 RepID=A0A9E7PPX5_9EURY|nr:bile acid:sodium symporter [Methanoplanus endosymbiosus]UUX92889.1 bile acid:sodium symporter [Methanoplanus endosymbiosus]
MFISQILLGLIYLFIISSMFSIGLGLSFKNIEKALLKKGVLTTALFINLLIIPLVAVVLIMFLYIRGDVMSGFLAMACAPGASYAPRITEAANGDVGHSTGLMFLLCTLAVFTTPFTLMLIIPESAAIDPWPVIKTLAIIQIIPILTGMLLRAEKPAIADRLSGSAFWASNLSGAVVIVLSLTLIFISGSEQGFSLDIKDTGVITAIILITLISIIISYYAGGETTEEKKSMAISSANRNAGVAFLITLSSFESVHTALIIIIFYIIVQTLFTGILAIKWLRNDMKAGKKTIISGGD